MDIKLDWLSFSLFHQEVPLDNDKQALLSAFTAIADRVGEDTYRFFDTQKWTPAAGRRPYSVGVHNADNGISVYAHPRLPHFLVEFSGKGMARLMHTDVAGALIESISDRVTRLDVAVDMLCEDDPRDFVSEREKGRFKASSEMVSESGVTCYVGSRTSDRYARVYRYAPPHPRSHLLRAEHVFKGDEAKNVLSFLMENTWSALGSECGRMFGWKSSSWEQGSFDGEPLATTRAERPDAKTLFWLHKTVAPVLARLHKEDKLDLKTFFTYCTSLLK